MLIFKNSLFSGSEQNAYCSETSSDLCEISKIECFGEYLLITNQICEIFKQITCYQRSFSLISISIKIFQSELHSM